MRPMPYDRTEGATPFDAVTASDQAPAFAQIASFDAVRALQPAALNDMLVSRQPAVAEPDGFGGTRTTSAPVYRPVSIDLHLVAFDSAGEPSRALLALLHHAGHHPHMLAFAEDKRLMALPEVPKAIAPLVHMWRHNDAVEALVVTIVAASRAAGRPVWPDRLAIRLRALDPPGASYKSERSRPRDRDGGITR